MSSPTEPRNSLIAHAGSAFFVDLVRTASRTFAHEVEAVVFDGDRVLTLYSFLGSPLHPRGPLKSEVLVKESGQRACTAGTSSSPILDRSGAAIGTVTVHGCLDDEAAEHLDGLALLASHHLQATMALAATSAPADRSIGFGEAVLDGLRDLIAVIDSNYVVTWCNGSVASQLGMTRQNLIGRNIADLIHEEDLTEALDAMMRLEEGHVTFRVAVRLLHGGGEYLPMVALAMDRSDDPNVSGFVVSLRNDERKTNIENELDRSRTISDTILRDLTDGVIAVDPAGGFRMMNTAARQLFEIDPSVPTPKLQRSQVGLRTTSMEPLSDEEHPLRAGADVEGAVDLCVMHSSGPRSITLRSRRVRHGSTDMGMVVTIEDRTDELAIEAELHRMALTDQLTGLPNRRRLEAELVELVDAGGVGLVAACFIDLDGFKSVNDLHGHRTGDELLRVAADRLAMTMRDGDLLARQGGDEFVALIQGVDDAEQAWSIAERLRATLGKPFVVNGTTFHLSASLGLVVEDARRLDVGTFLQHADIALYAAKDLGRDRVEFFDSELERAVDVGQSNREMIRLAIEEERLVTRLQPIVDIESNLIVGVESLVRCQLPNGDLVGPGQFIEDLVGSNLIVGMDLNAFAQSCDAARQLTAAVSDRPFTVACNFSSATLMQKDFAQSVIAIALQAGVSPSQLCIEITESSALATGASLVKSLGILRDAGFDIALDDFGTGYSSLSHLRELPLTIVKLDRSFVTKLTSARTERAIAAAIVHLSNELGFRVVAEGVETLEQLEAVRRLGYRHVQGWYFHRELALDELLELVVGVGRPAAR